MKKLLLTTLFTLSLLTACGGSSSGGGGNDTPQTTTIDITGTWNATGKLSECPNVTTAFIFEFESNNNILVELTRYAGNEINTTTCELDSVDSGTVEISILNTAPVLSQSDFSYFMQSLYMDTEDLPRNKISISFSHFETNRISYVATFDNSRTELVNFTR